MSLFILVLNLSFAGFGIYPQHPDPTLTPGSLCQHPSSYRYEEKIPYCNRDVKSSLKNDIIDTYEAQYNFTVSSTQRKHYKIDHYIPLCMGGSNNVDNLWPQQEAIYSITDPLESVLCGKVAANHIKQQEAIDIIKLAKNQLERVPELIKEVSAR